jgi:formate/nitrite transporter FocA (FNT family)
VPAAPEPHEIFQRTREEGRRRLGRTPLELASTALVAGFDIVFGVIALGVATALVAEEFGEGPGELVGAIAFGTAFVSVILGRSELFTENFLVPIAGLEKRDRRSWYKLAELWAVSPVLNLLGGAILTVIVTTHGVLPEGTGDALAKLADGIDANGVLSAFASAVAAGALITLMTWLVEAADTIGVRITVGWIGGALLALGHFNHAIVITLEGFFGIRYGSTLGWSDLFSNLGVAVAGNLVGGVLFVTLTRFGQAAGSSSA